MNNRDLIFFLLFGVQPPSGPVIRRRVTLVGRHLSLALVGRSEETDLLVGRRLEPTLLGRHEDTEDLIGRRLTLSVQGRVEDE